jgi:dihydroneopterin aldolase
MDRIRINGLSVMTVVGVHEHERQAPRELLLDLVLETVFEDAFVSDDVADTIDYDELCAAVTRRVGALRARLIEKVADEAATVCLEHPRVRAVGVTVRKPGAIPNADSVAVRIRREREW